MDIKNLELTEKDFQMLVDGLDVLPDKGMPGELMGELLTGLLIQDPLAKAKMKAEKMAKDLKLKAEKESLKGDIKILQGKLIMFKRYLIQIGALKQAYDILETPFTENPEF